MGKKIEVLHVLSCMRAGGIQAFVMNVVRNIDRSKINFTFLLHHEEKGIYEAEIEKLGFKIHIIRGIRELGYKNYNRELNNFFKNNKFDIVHSHYNQTSGIILRSAKKNKIGIRVSHSHSAYPKLNILGNLYTGYCKFLLKIYATDRFACGNNAGEWLFGKSKPFITVNNGIDLSKFEFNLTLRKEKRKELGITGNELLIGHVGRIRKVKNHKFLIEVFDEIQKRDDNVRMFFVGGGELKEEIEDQIFKSKLENKVTLLGERSDVSELLNIFDMFVLPSFSEGLPVTLVENQANGLKSYISDVVDKNIDMGCEMIDFISLEKSAKEWAEIILKDISLRKSVDNQKIRSALSEKGYDIQETAKKLEDFYISKGSKIEQ